jgi:hypothetical protein
LGVGNFSSSIVVGLLFGNLGFVLEAAEFFFSFLEFIKQLSIFFSMIFCEGVAFFEVGDLFVEVR